MNVNMAAGGHGPLIGAVDQGTSSSRFLVSPSNNAENKSMTVYRTVGK